MSKKKKQSNTDKQFKKLTQQYFNLFNNLTLCTNERGMKFLLKKHSKMIKKISQDNFSPEESLTIKNLESLLQELKESKARELGISSNQIRSGSSINLEEKSSSLPEKESLNIALQSEPISVKQNGLDIRNANKADEDSENEEDTPDLILPLTIKSKGFDLNTGFNQPMKIVQNELKPNQANYKEILTWLGSQGEVGKALKGVLIRLEKGAHSRNPYWKNSSEKLNKVLNAFNNLDPDVSLAIEMDDKNSELYQAVNMPRIMTRFTLFKGACGVNSTKSLKIVKSLDNEAQLLSI